MFQPDATFARRFTEEWIEAWNRHDLDAILSHYTDHFELNSPVIADLMGVAEGRLAGKPAVREYWQKALQLVPDLHFCDPAVFIGAGSIIIRYAGAGGRPAAELFEFDDAGLVRRASAHYAD